MPGYDPVRDITSSSPSPAANPGPQLYQHSHSGAGSASNSPSGPAAVSSPDDRWPAARVGSAGRPTPPPPALQQHPGPSSAAYGRQASYLSTPTGDYRRIPSDGRPTDEPRPTSSSSAGGRGGSLSLLLNAAEQMDDRHQGFDPRRRSMSRQSPPPPPSSWAQLSGPGRSAPALFNASRSSASTFDRPLPVPAPHESPSSRYHHRSEAAYPSSLEQGGRQPVALHHHQPSYPSTYPSTNGHGGLPSRSSSPMGLSPRSSHPLPQPMPPHQQQQYHHHAQQQQQQQQRAFSPPLHRGGGGGGPAPFAFAAPLPPPSQQHQQPSRRSTALGLTTSESLPVMIGSNQDAAAAAGAHRRSSRDEPEVKMMVEHDNWAARRADGSMMVDAHHRRPTIVPHNTWPRDESEIVLNSPQDALRPYSRGGGVGPSVLQDPRASVVALPPGVTSTTSQGVTGPSALSSSSRISISGWSGEPPSGNSRPDTPRDAISSRDRDRRGSQSSWTSQHESGRRGSGHSGAVGLGSMTASASSPSVLERPPTASDERRMSDLSVHSISSRRPSHEDYVRPQSSSSTINDIRRGSGGAAGPEGFTSTFPTAVMPSAPPKSWANAGAGTAAADKKPKKKPSKKELAAAEKAAAAGAAAEGSAVVADEPEPAAMPQIVAKGKRKRESTSGDVAPPTNGKAPRKIFAREASPLIETSPSPPEPAPLSPMVDNASQSSPPSPPQIFSPSPPRQPSPQRGTPYNPRRKSAPFSITQPLTREEAEWFRDVRNSKNPMRRGRQRDVPAAAVAAAAASGENKRSTNGAHVEWTNTASRSAPLRDVAKDVAEHYNMRPNQRREARGESVILGLKSFNNWVKSILISRYTVRRPGAETIRPPREPNGRVLDMGCGKGGDIAKWDRQRIAEYVGLDIADKSIRDFQDRINERNRRLTYRTELHAFDCFNAPIGSILSPQQLDPMFDTVSMQFCIHYAFENASKVRMMLENVSRYLRPGGTFFGTTVSDRKLLERLEQVPPSASQPVFGNQYYNVVFREREHKGVFGHAYRFQLTDAIDDCEEYVVDWDNFVEMAREYRLKCVYRRDFDELLEEELENPESRALAARMNVISQEGDLFMDEGQFEVCSVYTAFAFEKTSGPF